MIRRRGIQWESRDLFLEAQVEASVGGAGENQVEEWRAQRLPAQLYAFYYRQHQIQAPLGQPEQTVACDDSDGDSDDEPGRPLFLRYGIGRGEAEERQQEQSWPRNWTSVPD